MFVRLDESCFQWLEGELREVLEISAEMGYDGPDYCPNKARAHLNRAQVDRDPALWILRAVRGNTLRRIAVDARASGAERAVMLCSASCNLASKSFFVRNQGENGVNMLRLIICMVMIGAHCGVWVDMVIAPPEGAFDAAVDEPTRQLR